MKVVILGCGPSGLLAAHAAVRLGCQIVIVSNKRKSALHGCQYLHEPIPDIQDAMEFSMVDYQLVGTADEYAKKVYGTTRLPTLSSPQLYHGERPAWNLRAAYDALWERYEEAILPATVTGDNLAVMFENWKPDRVFSTIPAPVLCRAGEAHQFTSVDCWAIGDAPALGQSVPYRCPEFTVRCEGTDAASYYRIANVFGYSTIEWPGYHRRPPLAGVVKFSKPLTTNCDCWVDCVDKVGRYGAWRKGVLAHQVFSEVTNLLRRGQ